MKLISEVVGSCIVIDLDPPVTTPESNFGEGDYTPPMQQRDPAQETTSTDESDKASNSAHEPWELLDDREDVSLHSRPKFWQRSPFRM